MNYFECNICKDKVDDGSHEEKLCNNCLDWFLMQKEVEKVLEVITHENNL